MSPDSVVLEITFVRVPTDAIELLEDMWKDVDELHLPKDQRRRLSANGFRTGIVGTQLPDLVRQLLDQGNDAQDLANAGGSLADDIFRRRLHAPLGLRQLLETLSH